VARANSGNFLLLLTTQYAAQETAPEFTLLDSGHHFKNLVEFSADLMGIGDLSGKIHYLSPAWQTHFGRTNTQLISRSLFALIQAEDRPEFEQLFKQADPSKPPVTLTNRGRLNSGEARWLSWTVRASSDGFIYFHTRDITEDRNKQIEREAISHAFQTHSIVGVTDRRGRIIEANDAFCAISGYSREELIGQTHAIINSGHHTEAFFQDLWQTIAAGKVWTGDIMNRAKSGAPYWVDSTIVPVRGISGDIEKYVAIRNDITERKLIDDKVQHEARLFTQLADVSGVGTWEMDLVNNTLFWDQQTRRIHDVPADFEPDLDNAIAFYAPEGRELIIAAVENAIETGEPWSLELPLVTHNGADIWVRATGRAIEHKGEKVRLAGAFQEITLRQEHIEVLSRMRDRAFVANTAKTEFLSTVSHEIRTPLHGILGMTRMLGKTNVSRQQAEYVDAIEHSGNSLLYMVNDILDISRIESGRLKLVLDWCDPQEIVQSITKSLAATEAAAHLDISTQIDWPIKTDVSLDRPRFRQIISNLLANAIKFTPDGHVKVSLALLQPSQLQLSVSDSGIGLRQEDQERIFDRFTQVDGAMQRETEGSGLGLSVVRDLVELMGGTIHLKSRPGEGSTFTLTLPVQTQAAGSARAPRGQQGAVSSDAFKPDPAFSSKRALVVDDVAINRVVCSALLGEAGFESTDCESGSEALILLENEDFDVIFMDLHMPQMSGDDCIARIRASNKPYASIPIIVLTADVSDKARELVLAAGADDICYKPFQMSQISDALIRVLHADTSPPPQQRLILIDDDPSEFMLLQSSFEGGDQALVYYDSLDAFFDADDDLHKDDIILLDGRMPPISCHDESLVRLQQAGCPAAILLLSAERYMEYGEYPGLNILGTRDKVELHKNGRTGLHSSTG
jgi:PAS domain S-box-containing protein